MQPCFLLLMQTLVVIPELVAKARYYILCVVSHLKDYLLPDVEKMKLLADGGIVVCGKAGEIYRVAKYNTHGTLLSSLELQEKPWDMVEINAGTQRCLAFSH